MLGVDQLGLINCVAVLFVAVEVPFEQRPILQVYSADVLALLEYARAEAFSAALRQVLFAAVAGVLNC